MLSELSRGFASRSFEESRRARVADRRVVGRCLGRGGCQSVFSPPLVGFVPDLVRFFHNKMGRLRGSCQHAAKGDLIVGVSSGTSGPNGRSKLQNVGETIVR